MVKKYKAKKLTTSIKNKQRKKKSTILSKPVSSFSLKAKKFLKANKKALIRILSIIWANLVVITLYRATTKNGAGNVLTVEFFDSVVELYDKIQKRTEETLKIFFRMK